MIRYYVSSCEYKWSHADTHMEQMWVMREVGSELYKLVESNNWPWTLIRSNSQTLPHDIYCRCDIYIDLPNDKHRTHLTLKFPNLTAVSV